MDQQNVVDYPEELLIQYIITEPTYTERIAALLAWLRDKISLLRQPAAVSQRRIVMNS